MKYLTLITVLALTSSNIFATEKTVILEVPTMNCVTCPFTVKKALQKVEGVYKAEVTFEKKQAQITFNDEKTTIKSLTEATKNAGYPSVVKK